MKKFWNVSCICGFSVEDSDSLVSKHLLKMCVKINKYQPSVFLEKVGHDGLRMKDALRLRVSSHIRCLSPYEQETSDLLRTVRSNLMW